MERSHARLSSVMVICVCLAGAVVARAAFIQIINNPRLEQMARRQFQSKMLIRPSRGQILDRNGEPLAINVETSSLAADPEKVEDKRLLAHLLAKSTEIPYATLAKRLGEKREFVWIKRHLSEHELAHFKRLRLMDADGTMVSGLLLVKESQRVYPHGELAAHVLGDVNIDSEGTEGTELWFNDRMRGKVISVNAIKDALGRPTFMDAVAANRVEDGEKVLLTLDASLQFAVEQSLRDAVHKANAKGGSVIVMNASNGEILAMANQPAFNPNDHGVPIDRRRNRALTDGYEPGSTMKAVLAATALTHGWKLTDQVWGERGHFLVQGKKISEAEAHEKFEWISLKKIIQVSSNVGAAKVALKVGADHYSAMLKAFGFGAKTDTGFPGEISGRVPPRKSWQPLTLANIGFGQGVLVTPIQMARAYATFINGGWFVQPTLLKNSTFVKEDKPKRIISQAVADQVLAALEAVTSEGGTGTKARLEGYRVAGKTGTAQEVDPSTGAYSRSHYVASFIGFPLGVEQKIVIFTSVDEPHGVYYASETAAPLFREVLNAVVNRFSIPTQRLDASSALAAATKSTTRDQIRLVSAHPVSAATSIAPAAAPGELHWIGTTPAGAYVWKMPTLRGLTPREALRALQGHHFELEIHGSGVIRTQVPEEGGTLTDGETVKLVAEE